MVRTLKIKITLTLSVLLSLILVAVLVAVNIINNNSQNETALRVIEEFAKFDGERNTADSDLRESELFRSAQFYSVLMDRRGNVIRTRNESSIDISMTEIYQNASVALSSEKSNGKIGNYLYTIRNTWYGMIVVFMDMSVAEASMRSLLINSLLFGIPGIILICLISFLISIIITAPVKKTLELQKEFISDAGHELKTPLTVIKANADILSNQFGESKWLEYINSECDKMSLLISRLLKLSALDAAPKTNFTEFDLSELFEAILLPLECIAFEQGKQFTIKSESDIKFKGASEELGQVISILADNAIKYCSDNGSVECVLTRKNGHICMSFSNSGIDIPEEERERIFERFYRTDKARSGYEGYGLGLSIAKTITDRHGGKISVNCRNGITTFELKL